MVSIDLKIVDSVREREWIDFIQNQHETSIYHTPEWMKFLEVTFNYKPKPLFAINETGDIVGFLPRYEVKSVLTGNRVCSSPFSHLCNCIGDDYVCQALLNTTVSEYRNSTFSNIEVRSEVSHPEFLVTNDFCTHWLLLSDDSTDVWKKFSKGSVRWAIKKSEGFGVHSYASDSIEDLKIFYELNCLTKRNLGVLPHPWRFFSNIRKILGRQARLYLSSKNGEIIGGGLMLYHKNTILYGYGAANPAMMNYHPYHPFLWKCIDEGCEEGMQLFDFGRTAYSNQGLINFKKHWGTIEKPIPYSSYHYKEDRSGKGDTVIKIGGQTIKQLPMFTCKAISNIFFHHFG